jgi:hypothetical protein
MLASLASLCNTTWRMSVSLASPRNTDWRMWASLASPTHFRKRPFWQVLEFAKFAGEWPLLRNNTLFIYKKTMYKINPENRISMSYFLIQIKIVLLNYFILIIILL